MWVSTPGFFSFSYFDIKLNQVLSVVIFLFISLALRKPYKYIETQLLSVKMMNF